MLKNFLKPCIYVQLSPTRLTVRDPKTLRFVSEVPEIAVRHPATDKATIVAVGSAARAAAANMPNAAVFNPFAHPRSLVSDFTAGVEVFKAFILRVRAKSLFAPVPVLIIHPLDEPEGGFTPIEIRAFQEMAIGAGASNARIWLGTALTDEQLLSDQFPATGRMLGA